MSLRYRGARPPRLDSRLNTDSRTRLRRLIATRGWQATATLLKSSETTLEKLDSGGAATSEAISRIEIAIESAT